jgi:Mg2+/citrate symporter
MKFYDVYIIFIILFKTTFFILSLIHIYLIIKERKSIKNNSNKNNKSNNNINNFQKNIEYWRSRCEFVVNILISLLLIYLFNPISPKLYLIDRETKIVLFAFGFILFLTSRWSDFIDESKWLDFLQEFLS